MKDLEAFISSHERVVCKFTARWCAPCLKLNPVLSELARESEDTCRFFSVDVDNVDGAAERYQISSIPHLVYFKDGKKNTEHTAPDEKAIRKILSDMGASVQVKTSSFCL